MANNTLTIWSPGTVCNATNPVIAENCGYQGNDLIEIDPIGYRQIDSTCTSAPVVNRDSDARTWKVTMVLSEADKTKFKCLKTLHDNGAVGGLRVRDCIEAIPVGKLSLGRRVAYDAPMGTTGCETTYFETDAMMLTADEPTPINPVGSSDGSCYYVCRTTIKEILC